jgi:hypothetical protein
MTRPGLGGGNNNPALWKGACMESESDSDGAAQDEDETKWSFLRRLIVAMAGERLKKAERVVKQWRPSLNSDR